MNSNDKNKPPKYKGNATGEAASQPPKFEGTPTAQAAAEPPKFEGTPTAQPAAEPPKLDSNITEAEGKPSKDGKTFRRIVITVLVVFAISQLILFFMMTSKSCTRTHETSSGVVYSIPQSIDTVKKVSADTASLPYRGYAAVVLPEMPISMMFCGDTIDFDRIDMAERLDRELMTTIYNHTATSLIIKRANRYFPTLIKILSENDVPEDIVYLAVTESSLDATAVSPAKAAGMWQFMPDTGKEYGLEVNDYVDERFDVEKETVAACNYLKKAYAKYGDWASVCSSYNAGMNKISNELQKQQVDNSFDLRLVNETSRYVFRILAYKILLSNPKQFGYRLTATQLYQPIKYDVEEVNTTVDSWITWAREHDITYAQLREANPWIRSDHLPNEDGKVYNVKVPKHDSLYRSKAGNEVFNSKWVVD